MFKKIILGITVFSTILTAQQTICFQLDGKMGEELKALVEKYKGSLQGVSINDDTNDNVNIDKIMAQVESQNLQKEKINQKLKESQLAQEIISNGQTLYTAKCQSCHGKKAQKSAYNRSRALNSLTLEEIETSIRGYLMDEYDRGLAILMKPYAVSLSDKDVKDVYQYIQTLK